MYKKIYSKFTKERKKEFQIETAIYEGENSRYVVKRPLSESSKKHVLKMYDVYQQANNNENELLSKCEKYNDKIVFPFQIGESFCSRLLNSAKMKNENQFYMILDEYKSVIEKFIIEEKSFRLTEEFKYIFGEHNVLCGQRAATGLNIDLTFDNIICLEDGNVKIIDYEWTFDFLIPISFVCFRAINNLFIKYSNELQDFVDRSHVMNYFGITSEEIYLQMDKSFVQYVYGGHDAYGNILERYVQPYADVTALSLERDIVVQLYYDFGDGYSEQNSKIYNGFINNKKVFVRFDKIGERRVKKIRIDPCMESCIIQDINIRVCVDSKCKQVCIAKSNEEIEINGTYYFKTNDPWFECEITNERIESVEIEFLVIQKEIQWVFDLFKHMNEKCLSPVVEKYETQISNLTQEYERQIGDISYQNENMKNMMEIYLEIKHSLEKQVNELCNESRCLKEKMGLF